MDIDGKRRLFIGKESVSEIKNIEFTIHKPLKSGELNICIRDSSHKRIGGYNSVLHHNGLYMIWYVENSYRKDGIYICVKLAVSDDGINWELPELGLAVNYEEKPNNVVLGYGAGGVDGGLGDGTCMVFHDPNGSRFRMTARHGIREPLGLYSSEDGMHWERELDTVLDDGRFSDKEGVFHLDSQNIIFWDDRIKKYVAYVRRNFETHGQYRTVARGESKTLDGFPPVDEMDVVLSTDAYDYQIETPVGIQPAADFYTNAAIKYPWAEDAYFMFPNIYFKYDTYLDEFKEDKPRNAGPIDIRFASSTDGLNWNRHDRRPFVGLGSKDDFDAYSLYMLNGIVPGKGKEMYMYYMGTDLMHGWDRGDKYEERENRILKKTGFEPHQRISAISRLSMRRDGFISASADFMGGRFTSQPIRISCDSLSINLDTGASGMLKAGLIDADGKWLPGLSLEDCKIIHTCNEIDRNVIWNNKDSLKNQIGKNARIVFELVDSDLYSFTI